MNIFSFFSGAGFLDLGFELHGNYNIVDIDSLKAEGRLPEDYHEWWGFEDEKLFDKIGKAFEERLADIFEFDE